MGYYKNLEYIFTLRFCIFLNQSVFLPTKVRFEKRLQQEQTKAYLFNPDTEVICGLVQAYQIIGFTFLIPENGLITVISHALVRIIVCNAL